MVVLAFGANGSPGGGSGWGVVWKNPTTPRPGTSGTGGDLQSGTSGSACAAGAATTPTISDSAATASAVTRRRRAAPLRRLLMTCSRGRPPVLVLLLLDARVAGFDGAIGRDRISRLGGTVGPDRGGHQW